MREFAGTKEMMAGHNFKEFQVVSAVPLAGARFPSYFMYRHPLSLRVLG